MALYDESNRFPPPSFDEAIAEAGCERVEQDQASRGFVRIHLGDRPLDRLRYGLGAESFAWAFIFALAPLAGVYYPISILPSWVQLLSAAIPASYVFEGMRSVLIDHTIRIDLMLAGAALNIVWLAVGIAGFLIFHRQARERGMLLQVIE